MKHFEWLGKYDYARHVADLVDVAKKGKVAKPFEAVAKSMGLDGHRTVVGFLRWLKGKTPPPRVKALAEFSHTRVCEAARALQFTNNDELRVALIANFSALNRIKQRPKLSDRLLQALMQESGLRNFRHNGCVYVHWKQSNPPPRGRCRNLKVRYEN